MHHLRDPNSPFRTASVSELVEHSANGLLPELGNRLLPNCASAPELAPFADVLDVPLRETLDVGELSHQVVAKLLDETVTPSLIGLLGFDLGPELPIEPQ